MEPSNDRIRAWRAEHGLVPIATVLLALVALGARSCSEAPTIALYPVELIDPAPDDPFDTDPLFAPAPLDCDPCRERTVQLVGGDRVTIRSASKPGLVLHREDVEFLELSDRGRSAQADDGDDSEPAERAEAVAEDAAAERTAALSAEAPDRFAVYSVLGTTAREAWTAFAVEHARQFVLVELEGRPVDLIRPLGWSRGLRVGVFETEAQRTAYLQTIPFSSAKGAPYEP
jgi:hypothetical protein